MRWLAKAALQRGSARSPGRATELRLPAPRLPLVAGAPNPWSTEVLARARSTSARTRSSGRALRLASNVLRVRCGLGFAIPVAYRARRRQAGARRHPPSARLELVNDSIATFERLRRSSRRRPGARSARQAARLLARGARAALRDPLPRAVRARDTGLRAELHRLRLEHGHVRAHSRRGPRRDLSRSRGGS